MEQNLWRTSDATHSLSHSVTRTLTHSLSRWLGPQQYKGYKALKSKQSSSLFFIITMTWLTDCTYNNHHSILFSFTTLYRSGVKYPLFLFHSKFKASVNAAFKKRIVLQPNRKFSGSHIWFIGDKSKVQLN